MPLADLVRRAGSALVQTDDAVRTSEEELGFATAQYGADAVVPFQAALDAAKAQLRDAFTLKQKLDDAEPDTEQQARDWNVQIVQLCAAANEALDKQADAFDELRALEKRIPQAIAEVQAAADRAEPHRAVERGLRGTFRALHRRVDRHGARQHRPGRPSGSPSSATALAAAAAEERRPATRAPPRSACAPRRSRSTRPSFCSTRSTGSAPTSPEAQQTIDATIAELESDLAEARSLAAAGDAGRVRRRPPSPAPSRPSPT